MKLAARIEAGMPFIVGVTLTLLIGCGNNYARERNPSFAQGQIAPAPVATYPIMQCKMLSGTVDDTMRVVMEQRSGTKLTGSVTALAKAPETSGLLCSFVHSDTPQQAIYGIPVGDDSDRWHVPLALRAAIQKLSVATNAQTHVFTVAEQVDQCSNPTSTMKDADGRTVATVQSNERVCSPSRDATVDVLVFSAKAELLWHGSSMVDAENATATDRQLQALAGRIPAAFGDPASITMTTSASIAPAPAASAPAPAPPPQEPTQAKLEDTGMIAVMVPPPADVPIATLGLIRYGFRQVTLKGNSKAGYDLDLVEGGNGDGEIQAHIDGKLVAGRAMVVKVTSAAVGDTEECTGKGTLTLSSMPPMKRASTTPKVLGSTEGTLSLSVQCKGDSPTAFTVQGPTHAELTVQK